MRNELLENSLVVVGVNQTLFFGAPPQRSMMLVDLRTGKDYEIEVTDEQFGILVSLHEGELDGKAEGLGEEEGSSEVPAPTVRLSGEAVDQI